MDHDEYVEHFEPRKVDDRQDDPEVAVHVPLHVHDDVEYGRQYEDEEVDQSGQYLHVKAGVYLVSDHAQIAVYVLAPHELLLELHS